MRDAQQRVRRRGIGVALAGLVALAATACAGPDEFGPAPALPAASGTHPLAGLDATPSPAPSGSAAMAARPAPGAGGGAAAARPVAPRQPAPTRTSRPMPKPSVSPSPTTSPAEPSPTPSRKRPGWIQSLFRANPGQWCDEEPVTETDNDRAFMMERLGRRTVCFEGFAEKPAPQLILTAPDGGRRDMRADAPGSGFEYDAEYRTWGWSVRPGLIGGPLDAFGTYRFELSGPPGNGVLARGANLILSGSITVLPGKEPRVAFSYHPESGIDSQTMRPGGEVAVQFSGYRPGSRVFVTVYAPDHGGEGLRPQEDLPDVVIGRNGEGVARWTSPATAVPGEYGIWVEATPGQRSGCTEELCEDFRIQE